MIFYICLFLTFLYFKIARVYKKEERSNTNFLIQNILVAVAISVLFIYGFMNESWYMVIITSFIFFILSALLVSAVQLGIFIDGKPILRISHLFNSLAPIGMLISFADVYLWGL